MSRSLVLFVVIVSVTWAGSAVAQHTTGTIAGEVLDPDGLAVEGVAVAVDNAELGIRREVATNHRGAYRVAALPPGDYLVSVSREGFDSQHVQLRVDLGTTTSLPVVLEVGSFSGEVEVSTEGFDRRSSTSGTTLPVEQLDRLLPLDHDTTQIAILVPGTVPGDAQFTPVSQICQSGLCGGFNVGWGTPGQDLLSYQGASTAENLYVVDGLNITNFSEGLGSSFVPMSFVEAVQVKNGGLEAEFGRTTGGVVNMITKSGSNTLRGQMALLASPESLQETSPSTIDRDFANELQQSTELTASVGGPLLRDRLFFFVFARYLSSESTALPGYAEFSFDEASPYWGAKIDWSMASGHRLEASFISDAVDVDLTRVVHEPENPFSRSYDAVVNRGGRNAILRYSGVLSSNFLLSGQIGLNPFDRYQSSPTDDCPYAIDARSGVALPVGCWANRSAGTWRDTRLAARVDADWFVGNHSMRAGADFERDETAVNYGFSGTGEYYLYDVAANWPVFGLPPGTELMGREYYRVQGEVSLDSVAAYAQDSWSPNPKLTFNLGLRWERDDYSNAANQRFLDVDSEIVPRLGVVWDPAGTGRSKLYGSVGRYVIPYPTEAAGVFGAAVTEWHEAYFMDGGINPDGTPENLGELIGRWVFADDSVRDPRAVAADRLKATSQLELIMGYEHMLGDTWTLGVRGVARRIERVIEDVTIDQPLWEEYGIWVGEGGAFRIANPGEDFRGWYDLDGDGELDAISFTEEEMGYPDPERDYYAVELVARRRFSAGWMLEASYVWSHNYGNWEGRVNSDWAQANSGWTVDFDYPALMEHASGDLPNDRRHFARVIGAYSWPSGFGIGGAAFAHSGRPVNSFGYHPSDLFALRYGAASFYTLREPAPRGSMGRTDALWWLDLSLRYDWDWRGVDLNVRVDAFNVFNNDGVTNVIEVGDRSYGIAFEYWGEPLFFQSPRQVRFGVGLSF